MHVVLLLCTGLFSDELRMPEPRGGHVLVINPLRTKRWSMDEAHVSIEVHIDATSAHRADTLPEK